VRLAVFAVDPTEAVILATVSDVTAVVVIWNFAEVLPAGTRTEDPGEATPELDATDTKSPPDGAAEPKVTVPVDGFPPITKAGLSVRPVIVGGLIVNTAVSAKPF
jgi:hypothetical protein